MKLIKENDTAIIYETEHGDFEIHMKLYYSVGTKTKAGELIEPKDESWGCTAWSVYTRQRADLIFDEITSGERTIRTMTEAI